MEVPNMDTYPASPIASSTIHCDLGAPGSHVKWTPLMVSKLGTSCLGLFDMSGNSDAPPPYSLIPVPLRTGSLSRDSVNSKIPSELVVGMDIIALHTLGGTPLGSWHRNRPSHMAARAPANPSDIPLSTPCMWLRDILQPDFATTGARVLAYGYHTDLGTGGVKTMNLRNGHTMHVLDIDCIAEDLLCNVVEARACSPSSLQIGQPRGPGQQRPLIFIAHGLGGLVLKKALLLCKAASEGSDWRKIWEATVHVIFLSTPHDGGDQRLAGRWSDVIYASGVDVSIPSGDWAVVTKGFQALGESKEVNFSVASIIETMGTASAFGTAILIVTTSDVACLGWGNDREKVFMAEGRNHLSISDINGHQDPVYIFIKNSIREVIDRMTLAEAIDLGDAS